MQRAVFRGALVTCLILVSGAAPREASTPPQVKESTHRVYAIYQMDREVGSETYSKTVNDNNTVVFKSKSVITTSMPDSIIETSSVTLEDDSYFLIAYASSRSAGKLHQEIGIDVYANVADITTTTNGKQSTLTRTLPAGALCVQGGNVHDLALYLERYNDSAGGKQSILIFDPVGKRDYTKILEKTGQEDVEVQGATGRYTAYALQSDRGIEMKFFVDESGRIVRAENPLQRMVFMLSTGPEE